MLLNIELKLEEPFPQLCLTFALVSNVDFGMFIERGGGLQDSFIIPNMAVRFSQQEIVANRKMATLVLSLEAVFIIMKAFEF